MWDAIKNFFTARGIEICWHDYEFHDSTGRVGTGKFVGDKEIMEEITVTYRRCTKCGDYDLWD